MLQKTPVPIDFTGGLDTETDPLLVQPGKLLAAENLVMRGGTLEKRPGGVALPDATLDGSALTDAEALAVFKGALLRWTATGLYAYAGGASAWTLRGEAEDGLPLSFRRENVAQGDTTLSNHDCAAVDGFTAYTWEAAGVVTVTVVDTETGVEVLSEQVATGGSEVPRVVGVPGALVVLYARLGDFCARRFDTANPSAGLAAEVVLSSSASFNSFDAIDVGENIAIATNTDGTFVALGLISSTLVALTGSIGFFATSPECVTLGRDASNNLFVFFREGADFKCYARDSSGGALLGVTTLATGYDADLRRIGATTDGAEVAYFLELFSANGSGSLREVQRGVVSSAGAVTAPATWLRGVKLGGCPFTLGGRSLLPVLYVGPLAGKASVQPTAFVVDAETGAVAARMLEGVSTLGQEFSYSGFFLTAEVPTRLARVPLLDSGEACLTLSVRGALEYDRIGAVEYMSGGNVEDVTTEGLCRFLLSAPDASSLRAVEHNDALQMAGAAPLHYDGATLAEAGFHLYPEGLSGVAGLPSGTDPGMEAGVHSFRALYEWTDAQGNRFQSVPSPALSVTTTAGQAVTVTLPCLRLTRREGVKVVLYRTEAGGTIHYRTGETANDVDADTVTVNDGRADADLLFREILYADGGMLEALPPPAHRFSCIHGKRLVVGGLDDAYAWAYSQEAVKGEGLGFNEALRGRIPEAGGALTALASMDGKLVLFAERQIHVVQGDGPNAAGQQNTFTEAQTVASDVGCSDWRSVVQTPLGLIFKGARGFYLLTRGLQAQPIGKEVAEYDADTVTSAILMPDEEEVRFTTSEGRTLVYHYRYGQWLVGTVHGGEDAVVWNGAYARAKGGAVVVEGADTFADAGAAYGTLARTAWVKMAGIQGVQRVWRALFVGALESDCTLSVSVFYDYEDEEHVLVAGHALTLAEYPGGVWQLRTHLARQKCEAVSFLVRVTGAGKGASLTNLTLEVGTKKGARKLPVSRTA